MVTHRNMTWKTQNSTTVSLVVWCVSTILVFMLWQAHIIGTCTMATEHGITFMPHTTHGIITTDGITAGHGDLGTAGMVASGDGTAHTLGVTGDGDQDGITHLCTEEVGMEEVCTMSFRVNGTLLVDTWLQATVCALTLRDVQRWHHARMFWAVALIWAVNVPTLAVAARIWMATEVCQ